MTTQQIETTETRPLSFMERSTADIFFMTMSDERPSPPNPHVPCVVTTLTGYPPDTFPAGSNRTGLTTVSVLHAPPQDALISQLKVHTIHRVSM